jgi:SAM-dependent methyltransferase
MADLAECPLCTKRRFRRLIGYESNYLVACRDCGFVFSSRIPSAEDYARCYQSYDYASEEEGEATNDISNSQEQELAKRLARFRKLGRVLDIGAGSGRFVSKFKTLGFETVATEFNDEMRRYLEAKGIRTIDGGLLPQAPAASFDIIILTEVIEHLNIPRQVLARAHELLRPGGAIYVTTPNFQSIERRVIGPDWGMICWPEHITYWSARTLDRAFRDAGFVRDELKTVNISVFRIVQTLKKRGLAKGVSELGASDAAQAAIARNPLLRMAKGLINVALNLTRSGSSLRATYIRRE